MVRTVLLRQYAESGYYILFDRKSGRMLRNSMNEQDIFMNVRGPELLDISITNYCEKGCAFCYRQSNTEGEAMPLALYADIIKQAKDLGVVQVALGGGNPNQHPQFIEILRLTRKHGIIPTYTTNGQGMNDEIYNVTQECCGAIAVSWYEPYEYAKQVIRECVVRGIKVNVHFMLDRFSIREAIRMLKDKEAILNSINALLFLNYKPIHSSLDQCLIDNAELREFLDEVINCSVCKVGFDSCLISYIVATGDCIIPETIDYCEAGRFSAYISEKGIMYPCSFMNDTDDKGIDLSCTSIEKGWKEGVCFKEIRWRLATAGKQRYPIDECNECLNYVKCHGGCPWFPINRCREVKIHEVL